MIARVNHFAHLKGAALTDIGCKRKNNEDSFGTFPNNGVWCVADGMGGGDDGEVASAAVVKAIDSYFVNLPVEESGAYRGKDIAGGLESAVQDTSAWIFRRTQQKGLKGCGSTFVGVVFDATDPSTALALHAGDSRLYRLRGRTLKQITKDHSVAEMMGVKDDESLNPMFRGMILRAVGVESSVEVEKTPFSVHEGDFVLICSDGLTRMVDDRRISEIIRDAGKDVEKGAADLIAAAKEAGGVDNITVELVYVGSLPQPMSAIPLRAEGESSIGSSTGTTREDVSRPPAKRPFSWKLFGLVSAGVAIAAFAAVIVQTLMRKPMPSPEIQVVAQSGESLAKKVEPMAVEPAPQSLPQEQVASVPNIPVIDVSAEVEEEKTETAEDLARQEVAALLKEQRERRHRDEETRAANERHCREVAHELACLYTKDAFADFAIFSNRVLGPSTCENLHRLGRLLYLHRDSVDVCERAADLVVELRLLATRLGEVCKVREAKGFSCSKMIEACENIAKSEPSDPDVQSACIELMRMVSEQLDRNNRKRDAGSR